MVSRSAKKSAVAAKSHKLASSPRLPPYAVAALAGIATLSICALVNRQLARKAERDNPPTGRFVEVNGVQVHYREYGQGEPLVLLHGNGTMLQDFEVSGLTDKASKDYRVIAIDRPGFGYSSRPRGSVWTPNAQADLIHAVLQKIGVSKATILGHSWGTSVAIACALKYPQAVKALVLASGYYYPSARADVVVMSAPAVPVLGDLLRFTLSPPISRLLWPAALRKLFGPAEVPSKFSAFPKELTFRPSQIRASAEEAALMIPDAIALQGRYAELKMPVVIIAGEEDRLIDIDDQSARLHNEVSQSTFHRVAGAGHMVHQTATGRVLKAIEEAVKVGRSTLRPVATQAALAVKAS